MRRQRTFQLAYGGMGEGGGAGWGRAVREIERLYVVWYQPRTANKTAKAAQQPQVASAGSSFISLVSALQHLSQMLLLQSHHDLHSTEHEQRPRTKAQHK